MKKWVVVILLLLVFILSAFSGFLVRSFINFSNKEEDNNPAVLAEVKDSKIEETVDVSSSDVTVSPNAQIVITQSFKKCRTYCYNNRNCTKGNS